MLLEEGPLAVLDALLSMLGDLLPTLGVGAVEGSAAGAGGRDRYLSEISVYALRPAGAGAGDELAPGGGVVLAAGSGEAGVGTYDTGGEGCICPWEAGEEEALPLLLLPMKLKGLEGAGAGAEKGIGVAWSTNPEEPFAWGPRSAGLDACTGPGLEARLGKSDPYDPPVVAGSDFEARLGKSDPCKPAPAPPRGEVAAEELAWLLLRMRADREAGSEDGTPCNIPATHSTHVHGWHAVDGQGYSQQSHVLHLQGAHAGCPREVGMRKEDSTVCVPL